jgi:HlyD family secretion protein
VNHARWLRALLVLGLALCLGGCDLGRSATPTPLPTLVLPGVEPGRTSGGGATASGKVVPSQKAELSFPTAGQVKSLAVDVGDQVEAGAVLAALDATAAKVAVAKAQAALGQAKAQVAALRAGPRPEEIAAAQARLETVQAQLAQLQEGAPAEDVAAAKAELAAAQAALKQLSAGPPEEERVAALAALSNAKIVLQQAQAAYDRVASRSDVGMLPESVQLEEATNSYQAAQAHYDALFAAPDADVVAAARARVAEAQAALERLLAPASAGQIAQVEAQMRAAQAELDLLEAGTQEETIAVAEAAVTVAQADVERTEADLANTELRAPFGGTITARAVNPGEMVLPGQVVLTLADLSSLRVETTDLSERDVERVAAGQAVTVFVEALGVEIPGRVLRVAPEANVVGGDVVYTVTIELDEPPPDLRWGMSVDVDILSE